MTNERRLAFGAEVVSGGAHFRVFAPKRKRVEVVIESGPLAEHVRALDRDADGWFAGFVPELRSGVRYRYRLDGGDAFPDPASRFQPQGPHGPSEIVDPSAFAWTDREWPGIDLAGQVLYEMHVGTFTKEGTYAAAMRELDELKAAGITVIELLPLAEFAGEFGWGYDGVDLYAPTRLYGRPDELRAFVDRAHALGLGVIHDVVYNHLGPSGNYLRQFADEYFTDRYENEWGEAIDFETSKSARELFVANAEYWIDEYHFDGLRLDATQSIHDASPKHVVREIAERSRAVATRAGRKIILVAENEPQDPDCVRERGIDAMWNDDFHHSARVAATGRSEAYYSSTKGTAQELLSAVKWGFLFQGQYYPWQKNCRGSAALDLDPKSLVLYLQNHDQVANSASGARLHDLTSPGRFRALTTLLLLAPSTPMLFQGQEFGASSPFLYFADHEPELAKLVEKGRGEFLEQFPSLRDDAVLRARGAPHDRTSFDRCKLDPSERTKHRAIYDLHKDLLRLRREDPTFSAQRTDWLHGAVIGPEAFLLRYATGTGADRLVVVNLGGDIDLFSLAEPLVAPPRGRAWRLVFSTEDPRYGGSGTPPFRECGQLTAPACSAVVLA
jgi:maltooligosyltrehalose trehalohydrolase